MPTICHHVLLKSRLFPGKVRIRLNKEYHSIIIDSSAGLWCNQEFNDLWFNPLLQGVCFKVYFEYMKSLALCHIHCQSEFIIKNIKSSWYIKWNQIWSSTWQSSVTVGGGYSTDTLIIVSSTALFVCFSSYKSNHDFVEHTKNEGKHFICKHESDGVVSIFSVYGWAIPSTVVTLYR